MAAPRREELDRRREPSESCWEGTDPEGRRRPATLAAVQAGGREPHCPLAGEGSEERGTRPAASLRAANLGRSPCGGSFRARLAYRSARHARAWRLLHHQVNDTDTIHLHRLVSASWGTPVAKAGLFRNPGLVSPRLRLELYLGSYRNTT